jgi:DNA anti-recombination protein RmuC
MAAFTIGNCLRAVAVFAILASAGLSLKAQIATADSAEIATLFSQIKAHAVLAEADAEVLESYTRSRTNWQSHSVRIEQIREHVNDLIKDYQKANQLRPAGSAWQQQAIDQMEPLIKGMADHLGASIDHLNQNQNRIHMKEWQDYVRANRDYTARAAGLLRDVVDYSEAKNKADSLEQRLGVAENSGQ